MKRAARPIDRSTHQPHVIRSQCAEPVHWPASLRILLLDACCVSAIQRVLQRRQRPVPFELLAIDQPGREALNVGFLARLCDAARALVAIRVALNVREVCLRVLAELALLRVAVGAPESAVHARAAVAQPLRQACGPSWGLCVHHRWLVGQAECACTPRAVG